MKIYKSDAWLKKRYLIDKKSIGEMAKEAGVAPMTIRRELERLGLIRK